TVTVSPEQFVSFPQKPDSRHRVVLFIDAQGKVLHLLHLGENARRARQGYLPRLSPELIKNWHIGPPSAGQPAEEAVDWKSSGLARSAGGGAAAGAWTGGLPRVTVPRAGHDEPPAETGWTIVTGESSDSVTRPIEGLQHRFLWNGVF